MSGGFCSNLLQRKSLLRHRAILNQENTAQHALSSAEDIDLEVGRLHGVSTHSGGHFCDHYHCLYLAFGFLDAL